MKQFETLHRYYAYLRYSVLFTALLCAALFPFLWNLDVMNWQAAALIVLVIAYAGSRLYEQRKIDRLISQLRFEKRFVRQYASLVEMKNCIGTADHLWSGSCVFKILDRVLSHSGMLALPEPEKSRRVEEFFNESFALLRPNRLPPDFFFGLGILLLVTGIVDLAALGALQETPILSRLALAAASLIVMAEYVGLALRHRVYETFLLLEEIISSIVTGDELRGLQSAIAGKPYRHNPLYWSRPWFKTPEETPSIV